MTCRIILTKAFWAVAMLSFSIFLAAPAASQSPADSGYYEFTTVDGAGRECRIKDWVVPCGIIDWIPDIVGVNQWVAQFPVIGLTPLEPFPYWNIRTLSNQSTKIIGASFTNFGYFNIAGYDQFGIPHYATSWLYKDIEIDDPSGEGNFVDVQISTTYTWEGGILGGGNYEGRFSLSIEIEDITDDINNPLGVGSFDLVNRDRSGDQGLTDVAAGAVAYDRNNDTAHFQIMLKRGRIYRIYFKAEALGTPLLTAIESSVRAKLEKIGISISNDVSEQLALHDEDIKTAIAEHDEDIKTVITKHDEDIKEKLEWIMDDLEEIKRLLITPQGRREGFPLKVSNATGKTPLPSIDFITLVDDNTVTLLVTDLDPTDADVESVIVFWGDRYRSEYIGILPIDFEHTYTHTGTDYHIRVKTVTTNGEKFNYTFRNDEDLTVSIP